MASTAIDAYRITEEPYYRPSADEIRLYEHAYAHRLPLILKGPTGCGKTRFVEYMAWKLRRPLITLACNEDMTASDLVGRYLLDANGTAWHDGPLTQAVRHGGICYAKFSRYRPEYYCSHDQRRLLYQDLPPKPQCS